tara:strand:- start:23747 stop:24427 length:681 start_codon:yes stop_codon:yes gene_type:complete
MENEDEVMEEAVEEPGFAISAEDWQDQQDLIRQQGEMLQQFQGPLQQLNSALNQPEPAPQEPQFDPATFDPYNPNSVAQLVHAQTQPLANQNAQLIEAVQSMQNQMGSQSLDQQITDLAADDFSDEHGYVPAETISHARVIARGLYAENPGADPNVVMAQAIETMKSLRGGGEEAALGERTDQVRNISGAPRVPAQNTATTEAIPEPQTELEAARNWAERARGGAR